MLMGFNFRDAGGYAAAGGSVSAAVQAAIAVEATYLDAAFAAIATRAGSVENYLAIVLGIAPCQRERIGEWLIDPRDD